MTADDVVEIVAWLQAAQVDIWLDGGWGVDALVGEQTRAHKDLDVIVSRHFMFHHLEKALYKSRNIIPSALDEYDECCGEHDAEMDAIRTAFMAKWRMVPWLQTYKQMCIRLAKAKRFEEALWWAERGLAIYGENAHRPEAVDDLRKRAKAYRDKLASG